MLQAKCSIEKLTILAEDIDHLTEEGSSSLLQNISDQTNADISEQELLPLYFSLIKFIKKHTRFPDAKWALPTEKIKAIQEVAKKIKPQNTICLCENLFSEEDYNLYNYTKKNSSDTNYSDNYEQMAKDLKEDRGKCVINILTTQGIQAIIDFSLKVKNPRLVGRILGEYSELNITHDTIIFSDTNMKKEHFISGYIYARYKKYTLNWLESLNIGNWNINKKTNLLIALPFEPTAWEQVDKFLTKDKNLYWEKANIELSTKKPTLAIKNLIQYGRPQKALQIIWENLRLNVPIDINLIVKALLTETTENLVSNYMVSYSLFETIKYLQKSKNISNDELFKIEFKYLANADSYTLQDFLIDPVTLNKYIATNPSVFSELIQNSYRSPTNNKKVKPSDDETKKAEVSYNILQNFTEIPGSIDGQFNEKAFQDWLSKVIHICNESGHKQSALYIIGGKLINSPADASGLWINNIIAQTLDDNNLGDLRKGFYYATINSRGVHHCNSKAEYNLSNNYSEKAVKLEEHGYITFAQTLRNLAQFYKTEGDRIKDEQPSNI